MTRLDPRSGSLLLAEFRNPLFNQQPTHGASTDLLSTYYVPAIMLCVGDVEVSPLLLGAKSPVGMMVSTYVSGSASHASYTP